MAHELNPEQENPLLELGRLMHEESYSREKKGFETKGMKIDLIKKENGKIIVGDIKKSDRFLKSATMQLAYYLWRLKAMGAEISGELLIPKSKKKITVNLTPEIATEIETAISDISQLIQKPSPPAVKKNRFCGRCAYKEFCYA